jgi:hypothetical protein
VTVQPFLEPDHVLQQAFPDRKWAILLPTVAFVAALSLASLLGGVLFLKTALGSKKPKRA